MKFSKRAETADVYRVLVADLAYSDMAVVIMAMTLLITGTLAWAAEYDTIYMVAALAGGGASVAKLAIMRRMRRRFRVTTPELAEVRRWERAYAVSSLAMALSVSVASVSLFLSAGHQWHVLATALMFGYCAGIISRLSIRPRIAIAAVLIAALPGIAAAATWNDTQHRTTALMFTAFLIGSIESIRHLYARSARHVATRLDMATLARHDPLTGLVNRLGLREGFRSIVGDGPNLAIHCIDLDGFKCVNDRHGHAAGDALLVEVANRLRKVAGQRSVVARLGGDEFAVLQGGVRQPDEAEAMGHALVLALNAPVALDAAEVRIGASLGYVVAPCSEGQLDDMIDAADAASYRAKRAGGGVVPGDPIDIRAAGTRSLAAPEPASWLHPSPNR